MSSILQADVYVSSRLPMAIKRLGETSSFSPISCTLIHGDSEAVLVDTPISIAQTEDLASWIKTTAPGKSLSYVYITHGHGDHWFGISTLRKHWPNLRALATPGTLEHMNEQMKPEIFEGIWLALFPRGQIPQPPELATTMDSLVFDLEGHEFRAIEVGHTDTYNTTVLYVPSIRLVVAGDAVYGDVHQYFGEANTIEKRKEWLRALDTIEALDAHTVIAGHKRAGTVDGLFNLHETRQYILDFEDAVTKATNWMELVEDMQRRYPRRINPHAILRGAMAAFPESVVSKVHIPYHLLHTFSVFMNPPVDIFDPMESSLFNAIKGNFDPHNLPIEEFNILYNLITYPNASIEEAVEKVVNRTLKESTTLDEDFVANVCFLIMEIATNTVPAEQANLVEFVSQLQKVSVTNPETGEQVIDPDGHRVWQDLSTLGIFVTDFWNFDHRKAHAQAEITKWENKNAFLAQLVAAAKFDYDIKSLHPLDFANFGLFASFDAFGSDRDALDGEQRETAVRTASLWFKIAADRLWSHCQNQRPFDYDDECEERGFDVEQWNWWKQGLKTALDAPWAKGETRELIKEALEHIIRAEAGK